MWGRAFRGAFIGAVAGIAFSSIIGGITGIVDKSAELVKQSVEYAAAFEARRNAMTVFTGSASAAVAELTHLDAVAKQTVGLRVDDAEVGAARLRALGFEAKTTEQLLVGIAKQKIISGVVDEQAINRVIVNLQQLRAGSPQIERDVRQMILALPSLSLEIEKAFGSVAKFKAELSRDPEQALNKFAKSLADAKSPAGGLTNAIEKLEDEFILAGRSFGMPILEPLTKAAELLTDTLRTNGDTWAVWGQRVGDAVQGASDALRGLGTIIHALGLDIPDSEASGLRMALRTGGRWLGGAIANTATLGVSGTFDMLSYVGQADRKREEDLTMRSRAAYQPSKDADLMKRMGYNPDTFVGPVSEDMVGEKAKADADARRKAERLAEADRMASLANAKEYQSRDLAIIRDSNAVKLKLLDSYHRYTLTEELQYQKQVGKVTVGSIDQEIDYVQKAFKRRYELTGEDKKAREALAMEESQTLSGLSRQRAEAVIDAAIKEREIEIRMAEEKRAALIDANKLILESTRQRLSKQEFYLNREIEMTQTGYGRLIDLADNLFSATVDQIGKDTALQLQNLSLSAEQRANIEQQGNLDIQQAYQDHAQKVIEITDRQSRDMIQRLIEFRQNASDIASDTAAYFASAFSAFFNPSTISGTTMDAFRKNVLGSDLKVQLDEAKKQQRDLNDQYRGQSGTMSQATLDKFQIAADYAANKVIKLEDEIERLNKSVPELVRHFGALAETISPSNTTAFDIISAETLKAQQLLKRSDLEEEIALYKELATISGIPLSEKRQYEFRTMRAQRELDRLAIDQSKESIDEFNKSLAGTIARYEQLKKNDPFVLGGVKRGVEGTVTADRTSAMEALKQQELLFGDKKLMDMAREANVLREIVALRGAEFDAVLRIDRAQLQINNKLVYSKAQADAKVAEFLAGQKGITEIVSDAKINLLTTAYSGLESVADRLTRKFGAFRDVIKDLIANMLKLALNWFAGKTGFFGGGQQSGGGFKLPGINFGGSSSAGGGLNTGTLFGGSAGGGIFNFGGGGTQHGMPSIFTAPSGFEGQFGTGAGAGSGLLGQVMNAGSSGAAGAAGGAGGLGGLVAGLAPMLPIFGAGLGSSIFNGSMGSSILGGIGGGLAGFGIAGLIAPGAMSSAIGASLLTTAALSVFALGVAPALLIGAYFLSRNAKRRKEETIRNTAITDAFAAIDKLISDVNSDKIDGASALGQADQIRSNYVSEMSKLKDKKTREHALADVSRIDLRINDLKNAVAQQVSRKERLALMVPTFADGGATSAFAANFQNNPLGYQTGFGHGRSDNMLGYFPASGQMGAFSPTEYILDAETTRTVGTQNLDVMRATRGRSYHDMRKNVPVRRAFGGPLNSGVAQTSGSVGTDGSGSPMKLEITLNVGLATEEFAKVIGASITGNDGSKAQLDAIVTTLKNEGYTELAAELGRQLQNK